MAQHEKPILEIRGVKRLYGQGGKGVRDLSFSLKHGGRVALLGLNGAGKSTTFRLIAGLLIPDEGELCIAGYSLAKYRAKALQLLGYLPENAPLPLELTPKQYLDFECQLRGLQPSGRCAQLVEACELGEVLHSPMGTLSRGFRKRVALAGSLVHQPQLLLLDEPTAGLDPHQVEQFRRLILTVSELCTVLVSTHVLAEVETLCERCLILHHGRLKEDLALPCGSKGMYKVEYLGNLKDSSLSETKDIGSGWKESSLSNLHEPEHWLQKQIQAGVSIRCFTPLTKRLEDIFLEKTQREDDS
jgi:ABC-2 type transport system ATP-binding protein